MKFIIDRETYNDLEIFSGANGCLFSIIDGTKTEGGKRLLAETMHEATNDVNEMAARIDMIRFFCQDEIDLEMGALQMENVDFYLCYFNRRSLKSNFIDAFYDHWSYRFQPNQGYYQITTGVWDLIRLLRSLSKFIKELQGKPIYHALMKGAEDLERLLSDDVVSRNISSGKKIGFRDLSYLDNLFRRSEKVAIKLIVSWTYKVDMILSLAGLVKEKGWCLPEYLEAGEDGFSIEGAYHPGIKDAVKNDFRLVSGSNLTFLTGPNMAGKSSFLKTVGISIYLAHLGFPVPARRLLTPVFNGLVTTINLPDNIHEGLSHFYSEAQRIRNTAVKLSEAGRLFVIFDELFRGTNLKDAFEATVHLVMSLTEIKHSKFLVSSHLVDVIPDLRKLDSLTFKCFDCSFRDGRPEFSYKLKDGASNERLGMYILRDEGIFDILQQAAGTTPASETTG